MQEKKELKIKFKTMVILLILLAIIIVATLAIIINKNKETKGNPTVTGSGLADMSTSDFSMKFLKVENKKEVK